MNNRSLIERYKRHNRTSLSNYLNKYRSLQNIQDVITCATLAKLPHQKKHFHQKRLKNDVMNLVKDKLLKKENDIASCCKFHQIMKIVKKEAESGFGELAIYDTSLRIGAFLRVYPEDVYLHRGTLKGAKAMGLQTKNKRISVDNIPNSLKSLKAHEIEDFLCIYKDELKNINITITRSHKLKIKGIRRK